MFSDFLPGLLVILSRNDIFVTRRRFTDILKAVRLFSMALFFMMTDVVKSLINALLLPPVHLLDIAHDLQTRSRLDADDVRRAIENIGLEVYVDNPGEMDTNHVHVNLNDGALNSVSSRIAQEIESQNTQSLMVADELVDHYVSAMSSAWKNARLCGLPENQWGVVDWLIPFAKMPKSFCQKAIHVALAHLDANQWGSLVRSVGLDLGKEWFKAWTYAPAETSAAWFAEIRHPDIMDSLKNSPDGEAAYLWGFKKWILQYVSKPELPPAVPEVLAWLKSSDNAPDPSSLTTWRVIISSLKSEGVDVNESLLTIIHRMGWEAWMFQGQSASVPPSWEASSGHTSPINTLSNMLTCLNLQKLPVQWGMFAAVWESTGRENQMALAARLRAATLERSLSPVSTSSDNTLLRPRL